MTRPWALSQVCDSLLETAADVSRGVAVAIARHGIKSQGMWRCVCVCGVREKKEV